MLYFLWWHYSGKHNCVVLSYFGGLSSSNLMYIALVVIGSSFPITNVLPPLQYTRTEIWWHCYSQKQPLLHLEVPCRKWGQIYKEKHATIRKKQIIICKKYWHGGEYPFIQELYKKRNNNNNWEPQNPYYLNLLLLYIFVLQFCTQCPSMEDC